jgi:hypothetical protein
MWRSALITGVGCLALCAPAQAADSVSYARYDAGAGKGVVVLTPTGLAFQFFGLRPSTRYRLAISSKGCASSKGVIASKSFRTTPKGVSWDPAPVRATAVPRSAKVLRGGKVVACTPMIQAGGESGYMKVGNASPAIVVVDQSASSWRTLASVSGLRKNAGYRLVGLAGPCSRDSQVVVNEAFTANGKGAALVDASTAPVPGQLIESVAVRQSSNGQVVFCKTL